MIQCREGSSWAALLLCVPIVEYTDGFFRSRDEEDLEFFEHLRVNLFQHHLIERAKRPDPDVSGRAGVVGMDILRQRAQMDERVGWDVARRLLSLIHI